jgi:phosphoribosylglycinamide formyltransferase-1
MINKKDVLILGSGGGSNAEALVKYAQEKGLNIRFVGGCNRPRAKAGIYDRLEKLGVETYYLPSPGSDFSALRGFLANPGAFNPANPIRFDLILLAGYMRILPPDIAEMYDILNIHPSILPFVYKGSEDAYSDALGNGDARTGCTVHMVTSDVDGGPIIAQLGFQIPESVIRSKDIYMLKAIGLAHEHALYPAVMHAALGYGIDNIRIDMDKVMLNARELLRERGLDTIMRDCPTIVPSGGQFQRVFDSWDPEGRCKEK